MQRAVLFAVGWAGHKQLGARVFDVDARWQCLRESPFGTLNRQMIPLSDLDIDTFGEVDRLFTNTRH
jgi:hypothetical protein